MGTAILHSRLSKAKRAKVGAVLITPSKTIVPGVNGMPSGMSNECEDNINGALITKPEVIHAERNALIRCAKEGISTDGAHLYVTLSPCVPCAAMMIQAGIKRVVYMDKYRDDSGISLLESAGIIVEQLKE